VIPAGGRLYWIKSEMSPAPWHLTRDGEHSMCELKTFIRGLRIHQRDLGLGPPPDACEACVKWIDDYLAGYQ